MMSNERKKNGYKIDDSTQKLTAQEEKEYIELYEMGDFNAKQVLIVRNIRLVLHIANKFRNTGVETEELISVGTIGLIKGINSFDVNKKTKLATYISRCIQNEILLFLRSYSKYKNYTSLEEPLYIDDEGNELKIEDVIEVYDNKKYERYENMQYIANILEYILNGLKKNQKICILYSLAGMTQEDIGKILGFSQSYVARFTNSSKMDLKRFLAIDKKFDKIYSVEVLEEMYQISFKVENKDIYNKICQGIKLKDSLTKYNELSRIMCIQTYLDEKVFGIIAWIIITIEK